MADETKDEDKGDGGKDFSPLIKKLLIAAVLLVIPACLGLLAFKFVIGPMISEPEGPTVDLGELIPAEAVTVDFEGLQASLKTTGSTDSVKLLLYNISLVCDSQETADFVLQRKSYFHHKIDVLHRDRTESDLADNLIVENIEMQIKIEANKILKRINPDGDNMIIEVMHWQLTFIPL